MQIPVGHSTVSRCPILLIFIRLVPQPLCVFFSAALGTPGITPSITCFLALILFVFFLSTLTLFAVVGKSILAKFTFKALHLQLIQ